MRTRDEQVIAVLLGDVVPAVPAQRPADIAEQRTTTIYRRLLNTLDTLYKEVPMSALHPVIYYTTMSSPIGRVFVAATDAGVVRVSFRCSESDFVADVRRRSASLVLRSDEQLAGTVAQLAEYFTRSRRTFDLSVDLAAVTPFQRRVLAATRAVPPGRVVSYGDLARRIGQPHASRAVGQALGRNPIPIVIPCHRIIAGTGTLGGYTGGLAIKKKLLAIEGAQWH